MKYHKMCYKFQWTCAILQNFLNCLITVGTEKYNSYGALSHYPYKVGDHKSPESNKNTWKAELGHTAF